MKKFAIIISAIFITYCSDFSEKEQIKLNSKCNVNIVFQTDSLKLNYIIDNIIIGAFFSINDTVVKDNNGYTFSISIPSPTLSRININNKTFNLFLIPEDTLYLKYDRNKITVLGKNDIASINRFYQNKIYDEIKALNIEIMNSQKTLNSQTDYEFIIDSISAIIFGKIDLFESKFNLPDWFLKYEKSDNTYLYKHILNTFGYVCGSPELRSNIIKQEITQADIEKMNLHDNDAIYSNNYYHYLFGTISNVLITNKNFFIPTANSAELIDYLNLQFRTANKYLQNNIKNIYKTRILYMILKYNNSEVVEEFKNISKEDYFNTKFYKYLLAVNN